MLGKCCTTELYFQSSMKGQEDRLRSQPSLSEAPCLLNVHHWIREVPRHLDSSLQMLNSTPHTGTCQKMPVEASALSTLKEHPEDQCHPVLPLMVNSRPQVYLFPLQTEYAQRKGSIASHLVMAPGFSPTPSAASCDCHIGHKFTFHFGLTDPQASESPWLATLALGVA